jgi:hypothetical protein
MAYASSLRREHQGKRWPLALRDEERAKDYLAKHRPIGWSVREGRMVLAALRAVPSVNEEWRVAIQRLEDWVARYEPNELECLACGYHWLSPMPRGRVPKRCQMCGGYADVEGETMIISVVRDG